MVNPSRAARGCLAFTLGFLLALGIAASRPASAPERTHSASHFDAMLPPLPDSIFSKGGWTRVHRVPQPFFCGTVQAVGCYTYKTRTLVVVTGLSRFDEWETLEHEAVHMALGDAHFTAGERGEPGEVDDGIAEVIAMQRMLERIAPAPAGR